MMRKPLAAAAALTVVALVVGWVLRRPPASPLPGPTPAAVMPAAGLGPPAAAAPMLRPAASAAAALGGACRDGEIRWHDGAGVPQRACAESALASLNGGRRRYRFAVDGGAYLLIDTEQGRPLRIEWGHGEPEYGCDGDACTGVQFARPDFNGRQAIALDQTRLNREAAADTAADAAPRVLSAQLAALGNVGAVCETGVTVNFSDHSYTRFCAYGGNGYAQGDDGLPVFRFSDVDGSEIEVRTDAGGSTITAVAMPAEGLRCTGAACAGAGFSPSDRRGNRVLSLLGATLTSADGSRSATLNGQLLLSGD